MELLQAQVQQEARRSERSAREVRRLCGGVALLGSAVASGIWVMDVAIAESIVEWLQWDGSRAGAIAAGARVAGGILLVGSFLPSVRLLRTSYRLSALATVVALAIGGMDIFGSEMIGRMAGYLAIGVPVALALTIMLGWSTFVRYERELELTQEPRSSGSREKNLQVVKRLDFAARCALGSGPSHTQKSGFSASEWSIWCGKPTDPRKTGTGRPPPWFTGDWRPQVGLGPSRPSLTGEVQSGRGRQRRLIRICFISGFAVLVGQQVDQPVLVVLAGESSSDVRNQSSLAAGVAQDAALRDASDGDSWNVGRGEECHIQACRVRKSNSSASASNS